MSSVQPIMPNNNSKIYVRGLGTIFISGFELHYLIDTLAGFLLPPVVFVSV
jgi:hypothetical protein